MFTIASGHFNTQVSVLAGLALLMNGYSAVVIVLLHALQPAKHPAHRFLSEYVRGEKGALMTTVFVASGLGALLFAKTFSLAAAPASGESAWWMGSVVAMFVLSAVSLFGAGAFETDLNECGAPVTRHGRLHNWAAGSAFLFGIGGVGLLCIFGIGLGKFHATFLFEPAVRIYGSVLCVVAAPAYALVPMLIGLQKHPYRWVGLAQRVAVAALHIWAILVCWSLIEVPASGHEAVE